MNRTTAAPLSALLALGALAGCVTQPDETADSAERISYQRGPCFGSCPVFSVEIDASGQGTYRGERFVAVRGERQFTATPAQVRAFEQRLAPYRPASDVAYNHGNCDGPMATDQAAVAISWGDPAGDGTVLEWNTGCRQPGLAENREAIMTAWRELPLDDLVGTAEDRFQYDRD
ncbi:DUF6438 domain-containing protein [Pelagerythrobacter sp.]|uniref:DUF6438 domain-containing protein n=1 Tax=Pelagerythrobacter sp. TaxID=2800702 RepID=UPI0035AFE687